MTSPDVSALSYAELLDLSKELDQQIKAKRAEELKVLADGYVKKMEAAGFTVAEAIGALKPYLAHTKFPRKRAKGTYPVLFQDPQHPENTWSGRGLPARWLAAYESQGRSREEFRVKT